MGKRRKRTKKPQHGARPRESGTSPEMELVADREEAGRRGRFRSWLHANRSDLRFLLIFGLCLGAYFLSTLTPPVKHGFFPAYLRLNARASGAILRVLGQDVSVRDQSIVSADGPAIDIERGCDAVEPSALFVSAVLASPVPFASRLFAAVAGSFALMLLNLVRVVSLFLVRVYHPDAFETMHLDVWQALFIILAILLWAMWASRMARRRAVQTHASP